MQEDPLDYGRMMRRALIGLMAEALGEVAREGLPGAHHFYITFRVGARGVEMPDWLRRENPKELTIVLQHEFSDLSVDDERFLVSLSFSSRRARLSVPFEAVTVFADPAAEFGLRFDSEDTRASDRVRSLATRTPPDAPPQPVSPPPPAPMPKSGQPPRGSTKGKGRPKKGGSAEIVSLDRFRKQDQP